MPDPATDTATGIEGVSTRIAALLDPDGSIQPPPEQETPNPEEGTSAEPEEQETTEAQPEGEAEGSEGEAAASEAEAEGEQSEAPAKVTVTVDGKTEELPIEEVVKGYQRHADYSRKTADLARERDAFKATEQSVAQERAIYAQLLPALRQQLQATLPQKPDQSLIESDFQTYVRQDAAYREHLERLQAAQFEESRVKADQEKQAQAELSQSLEEGRGKVLELIPDWKDPAKRTAGRSQILDYAKALGASEEEVSQVRDPRIVKALWDASKYRLLMSRQGQPKPVVKQGPKTLPAGGGQGSQQSSQVTKAKQRLAQTGRTDHAIAAIRGLL